MSAVRLEDGVKYIVTKVGEPFTLEPGSYFVIKDTDVFGAPALYAYAQLVQTALELDRPRRFFTEDERSTLEGLAEQLVDQAIDWQKVGAGGKVPD